MSRQSGVCVGVDVWVCGLGGAHMDQIDGSKKQRENIKVSEGEDRELELQKQKESDSNLIK